MSTVEIDVYFDMRQDVREGQDPDAVSRVLRSYHQTLWSKPLPSGQVFDLAPLSRNRLVHVSDRGEFLLSSDTIATGHKRALSTLYAQLPAESNESFHQTAYTIAGFTIFPVGRGSGSINQNRGMNRWIGDRFDLTLEAIRRHYQGGASPLTSTLERYSDFFELFETFDGYIEFFLLDDLVLSGGAVDFWRPFDDFGPGALPTTLDDYVEYRGRTLDFLGARQGRIQRELDRRATLGTHRG